MRIREIPKALYIAWNGTDLRGPSSRLPEGACSVVILYAFSHLSSTKSPEKKCI